MTFFFYIFIFSLFTALGMAPIAMFVSRVVVKEKIRFDQALSVCFYASVSIWLVINTIVLYFGEEAILISSVASFFGGFIVYLIGLQRTLGFSLSRAIKVGLVLNVLTFILIIIGEVVVVLIGLAL